MPRVPKYFTALVIAGLLAAQPAVAADEALQMAKDLYAAAAYEDALLALGRADASSPARVREIDEYRLFCLYALGRTREAEQTAESLIRKHPLSPLESEDVSPRLRQLFTDVRQRLLPSLIRERVQTARTALETKRLDSAEPPLVEAAVMIVEAQAGGNQGFDDLSLLVDGYLQLIRTSREQYAASLPAIAATTGIADTTRAALPAVPPLPNTLPRPLEGPRPAAAVQSASRVYSAADAEVVPPVTIAQAMPEVPRAIYNLIKASDKRGSLDLEIDESGRVAAAKMREPINAFFDTLVLRAARDWRYEPATRNGVPVRYLKTLTFTP